MSRSFRFLRWLLAIGILVLGLYYALRPVPPGELHGPYPVERVVDGDTIIVQLDGQRTRVRLIGIDTPESAHPDADRNSPEGAAVSARVKALLEGTQVFLEYDEERSDKYGRTLAYVYLEDGETMVERLLLKEGLAVPMRIPPNEKYDTEFCRLAKKTG